MFGVALLPALRRRLQVLLAVALLATGVFLVLTLTRGAVAGAVAGLVVVALAQRRVRLVALIVLVAAATLVAVPGVGTRFGALGLDEADGGNGLRWRLDYWSQVLPLVQENPLTGIGLGTTGLRTAEGKEPHGDVVRALVETGALGLRPTSPST